MKTERPAFILTTSELISWNTEYCVQPEWHRTLIDIRNLKEVSLKR